MSAHVHERLKVLEFVTNFCVGGTERQFLNLLDGLRTEAEVHVACFRPDGPLLAELEGFDPPLPLTAYPIPSLRSPLVLRRLLELVRYLRRHEIDVVHTTGLYPNVFGVLAAWLARTPVIIASVRDMGQMWRGDLRRVQRWTCRLADAVVTNAEAIAQRLRAEGYRPETIEVIHNGIVPVQAPPRLPGTGFRRDLGIPAAAPLVGVVARIDPLKGLDDFLDAAALVAARHPETRFLIVGGPAATVGPEYLEELRRRAGRLGLGDRVFLTGARTDVPDILPELTVSVLPSLTEGLSNSLLEAMVAGKPVVATAVGGNPEIVEDGVTGFLVPANDPPSLAAAIERLVADPRLAAELGRAGQARVAARFTPERLVERNLALYRRLLSRSRGRARRRAEEPAAAWPLAGPLTDEDLSEERLR